MQFLLKLHKTLSPLSIIGKGVFKEDAGNNACLFFFYFKKLYLRRVAPSFHLVPINYSLITYQFNPVTAMHIFKRYRHVF